LESSPAAESTGPLVGLTIGPWPRRAHHPDGLPRRSPWFPEARWMTAVLALLTILRR